MTPPDRERGRPTKPPSTITPPPGSTISARVAPDADTRHGCACQPLGLDDARRAADLGLYCGGPLRHCVARDLELVA